jgi:hypothetical protein
MPSAHKKVVVRSSGGRLHWGYLPPNGFVAGDRVEVLEVDGRTKALNFNEMEAIAYVKDFNLQDHVDPEQLGRRSFPARPRGEGLWLRLTFREIAPLEGLVAFDLSFVDSLIEDRGLFLTPPDPRSNTLRLFVPRPAIRSVEVLGYISKPSKKLAEKAAQQIQLAVQAGLFGEE